jgi:O-succinylbenzoic acid--CoA ligase
MTSTAPQLLRRAATSPAHPAIEVGGAVVSYAELAERAIGAASGLRALGVRRGDTVAALLPNGLPFAVLLHAAALCGAAFLPLNTRLTQRELAFRLRDGGARLLLHAEGPLAESALGAAADSGLPALEVDACTSARDTRRERQPAGAEPADPDAPLAILHTSGTTGTPKGALLSGRNFFWSALASAFHIGVDPGDRWLACMPLFHVGGLSILLRSALYGTTAVVHERFDPEAANRAIDRERITVVSLVAPMLERMLELRGDRPAPPSLRCVLLGGGPAPAPLVERAVKLGLPVARTYGLTEAASQVATSRPLHPGDPVDVGLRPLLGTELRIASPDGEGGESAPPGKPGEILVRGPTVMRGYLNRPRETAEALRDGWLHTGDIGELDPEGGLRVLDRRDDLIVSGGENVYPAEIETVLLEHPAIAEAAVAGVADASFGRRPAAWLVIRGATAPAEDELRSFCRRRLASYKVPIAFRFVESLPRSASGKPLRSRLAEREHS